jgi:uncharacterized protein YkwD
MKLSRRTRLMRFAAIAILVLASLPLASCETFTGFGQDSSDSNGEAQQAPADGAGKAAEPAVERREAQDAGWDLEALDTARSAGYMSDVEKDVVLEINKARSDPARYAEQYIRPMLKYFSGNEYRYPGEITLITSEGAAAVQACIKAMKAQSVRPPLLPLEPLALAARDHVKDTGPKGIVGHTGSDGSDPSKRVRRYAKGLYCGENISYGQGNAQSIVIQFLIDDGVPSRGHRVNIMKADYGFIGDSIGTHKTYRSMCVVDFAMKS